MIPRACTEKLANALGIGDRVVWLEGLGHYTAIAELPRALRMTADFFAQDLPEEVESENQQAMHWALKCPALRGLRRCSGW